MFRRISIFATIVLFCAVIFMSCGPKGEVKIGAILPLTGPLSNYGELIKAGMDLAIEEINNNSGVDGAALRVIYKDSEGKPETASKLFIDLVTKEQVPLVVGGVSSTVSLTLAPIAEQNQVVLISPASSSPKLSGINDYFFRTYPSDTLEGYTMANKVISYEKKNGKEYFKDVVVVAAKTDYAEGVKIEFVKEFRRRKGNTKAVINYDPQNPEFPKLARQVVREARGSVMAVFIAGYYEDIAKFLLELKKQKRFDPEEIKVFACAAANTPEFKRLAASYFMEDKVGKYGVVFPAISHIDPNSPDELMATFAGRYFAKHKVYPETFAAHGYDTVKLITDVIAKRGTVPRDIQYGLSIVKEWRGVSGKITFDENHDVSKYPVVYGYDGKRMYLFDSAYKTKKPEYYKVTDWQ